MSEPIGLRESNKLRTRLALADAATRLFAKHGYDSVTMADVAAEAGVSRRTAFRYFNSKDELALVHPRSWFAVFDESAAENSELALEQRVRAASHAIANHIETDPKGVRALFRLASSHPALTAGYAAASQEWIARVAAEILRDTTEPTTQETVRAQILASACMGMIDSVCLAWASGDEPMSPLLDMGFDMLADAFKQVQKG